MGEIDLENVSWVVGALLLQPTPTEKPPQNYPLLTAGVSVAFMIAKSASEYSPMSVAPTIVL